MLVKSAHWHGLHSGDHDFSKPQGIHCEAVPRIGGLGVLVGCLCSCVVLYGNVGTAAAAFLLALLACSAPAFLAGFIQDFTEGIAPRGRLIATTLSAVLAYAYMGAAIEVTDIPGLDWLVSSAIGSLVLTVFTVAGVANAINIIDGLNGLASMCMMIMLAALAYVAFQVDDPLIGAIALAGAGSVAGLFVWNYPSGKIFLGDGGAYFLGFFISELSILFLQRNKLEVSPLFPLLVCLYPIFETLFSIYRRWVLRRQPASAPDGLHLHSLIYKRLIRARYGEHSSHHVTLGNSMTSPYLWVLCSLSVIPALLFWDDSLTLSVFALIFMTLYVSLYWRIVRFKTPSWLALNR
jgi:UDP-N-acetylmuramyl pentapeptide phosphotransferase/UDP-N-acetylglucosamine-1-phosphate transferase